MRRLAEIIEQYQVDTIVLGYPKNLDNSEGERCEKTKVFEAKIKGRYPKIPVVLWDERFSTIAAERALRMADLSHDKRLTKWRQYTFCRGIWTASSKPPERNGEEHERYF